MANLVTERFIKCHDRLKNDGIVRSSRQFALKLDYLPQSLSEILKGRRDVTIELLRKAVEVFLLNPNYLLTGDGPIYQSEVEKGLKVLTIVADKEDMTERIVHVPKPAQAGYAGHVSDPEFFQELPKYSLPHLQHKSGTFRSFDVAGDSMEPTLFEGDQIICSFMEPEFWSTSIKDNYVYVFVTRDDVLVKRVVNNISSDNFLQLVSDNPFYEPYELHPEDIKEIWFVRSKISPFLPAPQRVRDMMEDELDQLKKVLREQADMIGNLQKTIGTLVNQPSFSNKNI
jgi:plasmid maintenance system antidote protein VapI